MEQVKPIIMEQNELQYHDWPKSVSFSLFLDYRDSDARIKIHALCIQKPYLSRELPIELLKQIFKFILSENYQYEKPDVIAD